MVNSHVIPRHYLKGFENDVGCIFTYPNPQKHTDNQCVGRGGGSIAKNTATIQGYYTPLTEEEISNKIESKGSHLLRKIINKKVINLEEKEFFVQYILSFLYRVPFSEKRAQKIYEDEYIKWVTNPEYFYSFKKRHNLSGYREDEYFQVLKKIKSDKNLAKYFWENSITSTHKKVENILLSRRWWILEIIGHQYFITSDNPLYYSVSSGMINNEIQITFPLSQKMAIIFDNTDESTNMKYFPIGTTQFSLVDEINKRTADYSEKLYSPKKDLHLPDLVGHKISNPKYIPYPF
ncbi:MAG: hypothetical protein Phog2KO_12030 [Phototrophicaceae bacterium]